MPTHWHSPANKSERREHAPNSELERKRRAAMETRQAGERSYFRSRDNRRGGVEFAARSLSAVKNEIVVDVNDYIAIRSSDLACRLSFLISVNSVQSYQTISLRRTTTKKGLRF